MRTGRGHTGRAGAEFIALAIFLLPLIVYFYYSSGMKAETLREHRYFIVLGKYFPILVVLLRLLTVNL